MRVPWIARRSNQSILKEISPEYSLEGLMLKLKLQYFGHLMRRADSFEKTLILGNPSQGPGATERLRDVLWLPPCPPALIAQNFNLLPSIFPRTRVFSNESALHIRWPKYWSFSFNISPSNEHPGLIPFRMDWLDLLAVQGQEYWSRLPFPSPG